MEHVVEFLKHIGLQQYADVFFDNGYDSLDLFFVMDEMDFKIFGPYVGMKPGHLKRLQEAVFSMKRRGDVQVIDLVPQSNERDEGIVGSVAAAAAAPTKRKSSGNNIPHTVPNAKQARIASLRHSTQQGHSAMRDNKSGSNKITYRCTSVLSKKVKKAMGPDEPHKSQKCQYCLVWRKNKSRMYVLDPDASVMAHAPMCPAPQKVTRDELLHDPKFVHHSLTHGTVTGKNASENATSRGGIMDGSVNFRTAKRASNDVKRYHDKDYNEDWSKLREWGREYEQKNTNSRFRLQINEDTNRCVTWA